MTSPTLASSPVRQENNPHPYPIKTSQTGLLTRSGSSKAHGSWSRHHYTPVPRSPSTFVFNPPESSSNTMRQHGKLTNVRPAHTTPSNKSQRHESPERSERSGSMSPSPSKHSKTWIGRNPEGEQVKLPRHPYLWTPLQLATYLSSELCGSDGELLDSEVIRDIIDFVQQRKIGGRTFLGLDQEDFQEMEGIDSVWGNALWDASCTLRQDATPYRPSRISNTAYKRGRVRGIVNVFERSASESSDIGEDEVRTVIPPKPMKVRKVRIGNRSPQIPTQDWSLSESEDEMGRPEPNHLEQVRQIPVMTGGSETLTEMDLMTVDTFSAPVAINTESAATSPPLNKREDNLAVIMPASSGTPVDILLVPEALPSHRVHYSKQYQADLPESGLPESGLAQRDLQIVETRNTREIEIIPPTVHDDSEPTMAEPYTQTYGVLPPSPRGEQHVPLTPRVHSDDELPPGETLKIQVPPSPSQPPTALRPVLRRKASSPPHSLRHLFVPAPTVESASGMERQNVYVLPASSSEPDEAALRNLAALKERLEVVERRLEAMEKKEAQEQITRTVMHTARRRSEVEGCGSSKDAALDELDLELRSPRSYFEVDGEAFRSWQSAYILLAGATTGISVVLIPMLLRHLWTR
ncbi:hypothetical protein K439DRAFT_1640911 [Ramaria rubella]|nr:hypothetical protein K439DRAFT_1640911 [Ramaria rubella]